jgi:hypothetical protein
MGEAMRPLRLTASIFAISIGLTGTALAEECKAVLELAKDIYQENSSQYALRVLALQLSEMTYEEARSRMSNSTNVIIEGVPIGNDMQKEDHRKLQRLVQENNYFKEIKDYRTSILMMRPSAGAVAAWNACMANKKGIIARVVEGNNPNRVLVDVEYRPSFNSNQSVLVTELTPNNMSLVITPTALEYIPVANSKRTPLPSGTNILLIFDRPDPAKPISLVIAVSDPAKRAAATYDKIDIPGFPPLVPPPDSKPVSLFETKYVTGNLGTESNKIISNPVRLGHVTYPNGIRMRPRTTPGQPSLISATFALDGKYSEFSATFGIEGVNPECASEMNKVKYQVLADGVPLKFDNGSLEYGGSWSNPSLQRFSVRNIRELRLTATYNPTERCADGLIANPLLVPN